MFSDSAAHFIIEMEKILLISHSPCQKNEVHRLSAGVDMVILIYDLFKKNGENSILSF